MPESGSDSSDSSGEDMMTKGLTMASIQLGEGASIYLQMMKTFSIMFLVLTFLNLPLLFLYQLNTNGNDLGDFNKVFKYFTLGNLGQMNAKCSWSSFEHMTNESI